MNTLRYRFATPDEAPLLARLNAQLVAEGADFGPADPAYLEQRMRRWLESGRDHAVLFENQRAEPLAYALYREHPQEIYLRQFLVLNTARRNGIGRQAFELLRTKIWSADKRLTLEVLSSNRAGYRFWRSLGYRNCAVTLEIPAPAAPQAASAASPARCSPRLPWQPRLNGLPARLTAAATSLRHTPLHLARSLHACASAATHALSRALATLAFVGFVSIPEAAASPPAATDPMTAAELHALRTNGGHCAASIYRTAWSAAKTYRMEPAWIVAVIEAESSCRPDAVSKAGALGLMQLMPGSGARDAYRLAYGKDGRPGDAVLRDPQENIRLGVAYLHGLHRHFIGIGSAQARLLLAVAAYNCGTDLFDGQLPTAAANWDAAEAERWIAAHAPRQTHGYVTQVQSIALRYAAAIAAARAVPLAVASLELSP